MQQFCVIMFEGHQEWALQASARSCAARHACAAPHVAPAQRRNFTTRLETVVDEIWGDASIAAPSCCNPHRLGVSHRRDHARLCRLCANTPASKSLKYQFAVLGAKICSSLERCVDIGGNASSKAQGCGMGGGCCWGGAGRTWGVDWSGTWLSSSANKAISFTVPKIVIFEDVVLVFKCAPDEYYAKMQTLRINSWFTHLLNITQ